MSKDEKVPMGSIKINTIWIESVSLALSDQALDRIIDDLTVAAGGERGMSCEKLNIARWDLKAALQAEVERQRSPINKNPFPEHIQHPLPIRKSDDDN